VLWKDINIPLETFTIYVDLIFDLIAIFFFGFLKVQTRAAIEEVETIIYALVVTFGCHLLKP
jgi:hypothetical protein